ncbi:hypothetical protein YQE_08557, partial [Dendroctonus ponderosae]
MDPLANPRHQGTV